MTQSDKRARFRRPAPLGRLSPAEDAVVEEGWQLLRSTWRWLRRDPAGWLSIHLRRPGELVRLLRLLFSCAIVSMLAAPALDR